MLARRLLIYSTLVQHLGFAETKGEFMWRYVRCPLVTVMTAAGISAASAQANTSPMLG